ncbi:hypothetical protein N7466_003304 [Penicillium verhagenii]|uniref:uncharacterized protein n=1 Tax=Penicillium verhagenii TaxID=1562060 RepID=UPI002545AE5A|nr:uncharacterized protein N7466_003304 [Penicillium verhagenii]KAJ5936854.1 hypothetical protein N7466_003304 [Penicillium verhagenii]
MSYQDTSYYRRPHSLERGATMVRDDHAVKERNYDVGHRQLEEIIPITSIDVTSGINIDHMKVPRKRDSSPESSRSYRHRNRHKSMDGGSRDGRDDKSYSSDGDRDNSNHDRGWADGLLSKGGKLLAQAAVPLIAAGAAEALRSRNEPGEWKGDKGKHVMKSAVTNGLMNKDPSTPHRHHVVDTTMSGLKDGRPSREEMAEIRRRAATNHTLDNLKKVAAAGALVFAGKEIYDRYERSKSQKRGQDYDKDYDDNRHSSNRGNRSDSEDSNSEMWSRDLDERAYRRPRSKYRDDRSDHWENYSGRNHG